MQTDDSETALPKESELDVRQLLQRLTKHVSAIAARLDDLSGLLDRSPKELPDHSCFSFERGQRPPKLDEVSEHRTRRPTRPPLPDPRLVREIIRKRQLRKRHFDGDLFSDPVWDMLLDLTAARAEHTRVSVTSLCIASGVPPTTALRWIAQMADAGLVQRVDDGIDRRRAFIALTDKAAHGMARYFAEVDGMGEGSLS